MKNKKLTPLPKDPVYRPVARLYDNFRYGQDPDKPKGACLYWKRYKAEAKPTCGCQSCATKWNAKLIKQMSDLAKQLVTIKK